MLFADRLKELREKSQLTQQEMADRSGISIWTIRGYEQGNREPDWLNAILLARALRVSAEDGFGGCQRKPDQPDRSKKRGNK